MKQTITCPHCSKVAHLARSILLEDMYVYKCSWCRVRFTTKEVVDHNASVGDDKNVEVKYEQPLLERFNISAVICSWAQGPDMEPRHEFHGVYLDKGQLLFRLTEFVNGGI